LPPHFPVRSFFLFVNQYLVVLKKMFVPIVCTMCSGLLCNIFSYGQTIWLSAEKQQYAGTYSRHFQQTFSALQNPAALPYITASAGVNTERRFMLKALSVHTAVITVPAPPGAFAINIQQAGYSAYHQQQAGFAYGRQLGNKLSIGMQIDYLSTTIQQYGSTNTITFELGCLLHITSQLHAGIHVFNPAARKSGDEPLSVIYTAGLGYEVSDEFIISAAVVQVNDAAPVAKVMCEYRIVPQLSLQLATSPTNAAASFTVGRMRIFLSASHHPQLGFTPNTSIVWQLKKA
jgi:hypothetical protein